MKLHISKTLMFASEYVLVANFADQRNIHIDKA